MDLRSKRMAKKMERLVKLAEIRANVAKAELSAATAVERRCQASLDALEQDKTDAAHDAVQKADISDLSNLMHWMNWVEGEQKKLGLELLKSKAVSEDMRERTKKHFGQEVASKALLDRLSKP